MGKVLIIFIILWLGVTYNMFKELNTVKPNVYKTVYELNKGNK
jgi:hypothetical protein